MALTSAVTEAAFAARRQRDWDELDALTLRVTRRGLRALAPEEVARLSPLYRDVCGDLARAQAARYSGPLVDYLQGLTAASHTVLYGARARAGDRGAGGEARSAAGRVRGRDRGFRRAAAAFPRAVRAPGKAMALAAALFFVPFALGLAGALHDPQFAFRVAPESMLRPLTEAYARGFEEGRAGGEGALMAGFYVNNNVGIALRCFALGVFGGLGSAFYLVQNGLSIGAIVGYVASQGAGGNILTFIVGHGSLELGAIVIAGGAGLAIGGAMILPGDRTRLASVQAVAGDIVIIVCGAAVMLLMAAGIEAFWSGSSVPSGVKRGVGAAMFVVVMAYLAFGGRARGAAPERD
jgi:uncharacterized membrane protein SpoIIM required for sporulation